MPCLISQFHIKCYDTKSMTYQLDLQMHQGNLRNFRFQLFTFGSVKTLFLYPYPNQIQNWIDSY